MSWFSKAEEDKRMAVAKRGVEEMLTTTDVDWQKERLLKQSYDQTRQLQLQVEGLQAAIRSIVLRLRVLDLDQMEKDMAADGTVPLRFALSELRALVNAYALMPHNIDDERKRYATMQQYYQQQQQTTTQSATAIPSYYYGNTTGGIKP